MKVLLMTSENTFENADDVINVATKMIFTERFKEIMKHVDIVF